MAPPRHFMPGGIAVRHAPFCRGSAAVMRFVAFCRASRAIRAATPFDTRPLLPAGYRLSLPTPAVIRYVCAIRNSFSPACTLLGHVRQRLSSPAVAPACGLGKASGVCCTLSSSFFPSFLFLLPPSFLPLPSLLHHARLIHPCVCVRQNKYITPLLGDRQACRQEGHTGRTGNTCIGMSTPQGIM